MDIEGLLGSVLGSAVSSRGARKGASRLVKTGLRHPGALIGIAGAAWGLYEVWKRNQPSGAAGATGAPPTSPPPPIPTAAGGPVPPPPPIPTATTAPASAAPIPPEALRVLRLVLSAARADGELGPLETEQVLAAARESGAETLVHDELQRTVPLAELVAGVSDPAHREQLYRLAFTVVHADAGVTGSERIYLTQLAHLMGLPAGEVQRIEQDVIARASNDPAR